MPKKFPTSRWEGPEIHPIPSSFWSGCSPSIFACVFPSTWTLLVLPLLPFSENQPEPHLLQEDFPAQTLLLLVSHTGIPLSMLHMRPPWASGLIQEALTLPGLMTFSLQWGQSYLLYRVVKRLAHSRCQQLLLPPDILQEREA